jgi:hypothetical protein
MDARNRDGRLAQHVTSGPPSRICTKRHFARCVVGAIEPKRAAVIPGHQGQ